MIDPQRVHPILKAHQLADGFPIVLDLEASHGPWLKDSVSGEEFLDAFTCFASWPIGYNHAGLLEPEFRKEIELVARHKPSSSDLYTTHQAAFVEAFATHVTPEGFPHHFFISGGTLAVENALKTAFDWKARRVGVEQTDDGNQLVVLHFREAFHGRSGYTMSLTNTDPTKVSLFPKFKWPRVHNPKIVFDDAGGIANDVAVEEQRACEEIEAAFREYGWRIAAILIEPMQGEGGDNHFRPEFMARLRAYAHEQDCLLIFDEVQTGFFGSGKAWMWQHHGVQPDVVAFGKKTQVCGIYAGTRIDEVPGNVFQTGSRINSTWGGNLVDMVRCRKLIDLIRSEKLVDNLKLRGAELLAGLRALAKGREDIGNVRGMGSLVAFDLEDGAARDRMRQQLYDRRVLVLPCGPRSIRFRLPFVLKKEEVDFALERVSDCLTAGVRS
jgi:L-lysine 6-transaminase